MPTLRALPFVAVALAFGALAAPAMARPGGGQSFHSTPAPSSHSSGGGSTYHGGGSTYHGGSTYNSSDSSDSSGSPIVFVLIIAFVIFLVIMAIVKKARGPERAKVAVDDGAAMRGLAALQQQDPSFDAAAFATRAAQTMEKVNQAWVAGAMGPARRLVSDGVYVRFQTQLGLLKTVGVRNLMANWKCLGASIVAAEADTMWDTVHVKVVGEARDCEVPLSMPQDQAQKKVQSASVEQYEEVWSFVRRRGTKSKAGVPALEGRCPQCGADLPLGDTVRCDFCKGLVNSGEHDWVLAEITQPEVWQPGSASAAVQGLDQVRQRDAGLSRQELEDRASVVMWKWIEARITGSRQRLDRFCKTPGQPSAPTEKMIHPTVGSAELRTVQPGTDGFDRAIVELVWSYERHGQEPATPTTRIVLARSSQVVSRKGLSSLDCPNCDGPLAESDAVKCQYCGATLGGGQQEWSVEAIQDVA